MTGAAEVALLERLVGLAAAAGGGGPFAAAVVTQGEVTSIEVNAVQRTTDPSAHAEVVAIRAACAALGTTDLSGSLLYSSCEPCMMCAGAALWAGIPEVAYAAVIDAVPGPLINRLFPPGSYRPGALPLRLRHVPVAGAVEALADRRGEPGAVGQSP